MKFDSDKFIELYTKRYSLPDEDLQLTISRLINDGIQATENDELKAFTTLVEQCIENPNDIYKTYGDYKKTNLEKAMELWLMYGPKCLLDNKQEEERTPTHKEHISISQLRGSTYGSL